MFPFMQTNESLERRRQLQKQRLRHRVQIQSRQIEQVMQAHHLPAYVSGGKVASHSIQFDLQAQLSQSWDRIRELTTDLRHALGVPQISVTRENGRLQVAVGRSDDVPVALLDVLAMSEEIPPETAVLGLSDDGLPVTCSLRRADYPHILISGAEEAGKTSLLRTISVSLALWNRPSHLQQIIMTHLADGAEREPTLDPLVHLPHLAADAIIYDMADTALVLNWLVDEMETRSVNGEITPTLIVMVDNVTQLMADGGADITEPLTLLLQRGGKAGIHLILTTAEPHSSLLDSHMKAFLPIRIAGRVENAAQATASAGIENSGADYLLGRGDFLLVDNKQTIYFQAAYVGDYDLHLSLMRLRPSGGYAILAQPFLVRPTVPEAKPAVKESAFSRKDNFFEFAGEGN